MNFRTTYILFGLLALVLVMLGVALWVGPEKPTSAFLLPSLHNDADPVKSEDIVTLEINRNRPKEETLVFERDPDSKNWKMTQPHALKVESYQVDRLVGQVLDARRDEKAETNSNLKEWGLEPPAEVITLKDKNNREWKLNVGNESPGTDERFVYVTSTDRPSPVSAMKYNQLDVAFKTANDFRTKDLLASYAADIKYVALHDGKHDPVILAEAGPSHWRFKQPENFGDAQYNATDAPADAKNPKAVYSLLEALAGLKVAYDPANKVDDFVEDDARDLKKYGLEDGVKDRLSIKVERTVTGKATDKDKTTSDTLLIGKKADDKGEKVYARLDSDHNVVRLPAKSLEPVTNVLDDKQVLENLRDHNLVEIDAGKTLDALDVQDGSGKTFRLRRLEGKGEFGAAAWKIYRDGMAPQNADAAAVDALVNALKEKHLIQEFLPKNASEGKAVATITLWVDSLEKEEPKKDDKKDEKKDEAKKDDKKDDKKKDDKKEEKKDPNAEPKMKAGAKDKPAYRLTFGSGDAVKKAITVKRQTPDETTVVLVPDRVVDKVTAGPLAYLDKALPKLEGDVTKVVIDRGGEAWELKEEKKNGKTSWKIEKPKELAGGTADAGAVSHITNDLSFLRAEKLLEEKATPDLEKKYGLDKPKAKVVLTTTKDGKNEEHVYVFGNDADAGTVYVEMGKDGPLFTVRKEILTDVQGELRDKTVFNITPAKVKEMKLTGWYDYSGPLLGKPYTLDLEHKGLRDWALKEATTPTFKQVDVDKAENFLDSVVNLQLKQFLTPKTAAKAEHKLDLEKDNALKIELVVEGEKAAKETYTLTVGGSPSGDTQSFYATSSRLPGEVFLVPSFPFEKVKNKGMDKDGTPFYFQK
jgi:hypothetical protein